MKAGRELDALNERVAIEIMGWRRMSWRDYHAYMNFSGTDERDSFAYAWHDAEGNMTEAHVKDKLYFDNPTPSWSPSEEIADAWLVVEKLKADNWRFDITSKFTHSPKEPKTEWGAWFTLPPDGIQGEGYADTAPLAICLAALKAVE